MRYVTDPAHRARHSASSVPATDAVPLSDMGVVWGVPVPSASAEQVARNGTRNLTDNDPAAGSALLRWLHVQNVDRDRWDSISRAIPPHSLSLIVSLAWHNASSWATLAAELESRIGSGTDSPANRPDAAEESSCRPLAAGQAGEPVRDSSVRPG